MFAKYVKYNVYGPHDNVMRKQQRKTAGKMQGRIYFPGILKSL